MAQLVQLYTQTAKVIDSVNQKKGTVTSISLQNKNQKSATYALSSEILKYNEIIEKIIEDSKILKNEPNLKKNKTLLKVAIYELLLGKKDSQVVLKEFSNIKVPIFPLVKKYYSDLNTALVMLKIEKKSQNNEDLLPKIEKLDLPRYIRVNTKKSTLKEVEQELEKKNLTKDKEYKLDHIIPNLISIPETIKLHNDPLLTDGKIVIQDKASCLPSFLMYDIMNEMKCIGNVIDACAAPGNKTSHIADLLHHQQIYAFDRDAKRLKTLEKLVQNLGLTNVKAQNKDFKEVNPKDYKDVNGIILDPSCSGSGILNREKEDEEYLKNRLKNLSNLQISLIKHAFKFPSVKIVTYSTCSIHDEENEKVVETILKEQDEFVVKENIIPEWKTRGKDSYKFGCHCLRAYPEKDNTRNGFFVVVFVRNKKRKLNEEDTKGKKKK